MKHSSVFFLVAIILFFCAACSNGKEQSVRNTDENQENITSVEMNQVNADELAQQAYDLIDEAESLCKGGMGVISAAWHFGIWNAPECEVDTVMARLSAQMGFETSFVEKNCAYTPEELINGDENFDGWEFCLITAEDCLSASGVYTSVNKALEIARGLIREIPTDYENYQYLKDYYTQVAAYAAYFEEVTGSYNDLIGAIDDYESKIKTAKEPLLFDFE